MTVKSSIHVIELTSSDAYDIACDIASALTEAVKTHWVKYPESWLEQEKYRIERMKQFFTLSTYDYVYDMKMRDLHKIIEDAEKSA